MPDTPAEYPADRFHAFAQCVLGTKVDDHITVTAVERPADNVLIGHTYVVEYVDPDLENRSPGGPLVIVHPGIALFPARGDRWELAA